MTDDVEMKDEIYDPSKALEKVERAYPLLAKALSGFDNKYVSLIFRDLPELRKELTAEVLGDALARLGVRKELSKFVLNSSEKSIDVAIIPEIELYFFILLQIHLLDSGKLTEVSELNDYVINFLNSHNKRSLDLLESKSWFYIGRTYELSNDFKRDQLLYALRTATLRHNHETQGMIITLLLRSYLLTHEIQQAVNLIEKIEFPENIGNSLVARYYFYLAKISAIQLDYTTSHDYVIAAIRKAPQTDKSIGFLQSSSKLRIVIELLMGDIPELSSFENFLEPYFKLTKTVKEGDLNKFGKVLETYKQNFIKDDTYTLVSRLRQNVIKTGIRIISLSYSKISLKDICIKLHLDNEESTEYIVSKAIRDGVIEGSINHEKGYMQSKEINDIYSTKEPQNDFDQRIKFCLSLYSDSVKSMRFPSENKTIEEEIANDEVDLMKAIEDGELDEFMD